MQRLFATAGVAMLVSLTLAQSPHETVSAIIESATTARAVSRHGEPMSASLDTDDISAVVRLSPQAPDATPPASDNAAGRNAADNEPVRLTLLADAFPSLAALDAAFDVPVFPALAALDEAFDNRPVELPPVPLPWRRPPTFAETCATLASAASAYKLPAPFLIRLIWQESRFYHNVVSTAGARGIAQFMPETATDMRLDDPFDPLEALPVSAQLLQKLIARFGNIGLAAAAYNAGPKRVLDWLAGKGELPKETQDYVKTVTGQPVDGWRNPDATAPLQRVPAAAPCQREAGLYAADGPARIPLPADSPTVNPEKTLLAAADLPATAGKRVVASADTGSGLSAAKKHERGTLKAVATAATKRIAATSAETVEPAKAKTSHAGSAKSANSATTDPSAKSKAAVKSAVKASAKSKSAAGKGKAASDRSARRPAKSAKKFAAAETR